jgi:hypothetical protein
MPILQNPRYETFAQARAKGALLEDAYELAGYVPGNSHASKLAQRPEVAERIGELRAELAGLADASPVALIAALLRVAKASEDLSSAAGVREARMTLLEVSRLNAALVAERGAERESYSWREFKP